MADRAEASRFTEWRNYLEVQAIAAQQREAATGTVLAERFAQQQQHQLYLKEVHRAPIPAFPQRLEGAKTGGVMSYENIVGAWLSVFRKTRKRPVGL